MRHGLLNSRWRRRSELQGGGKSFGLVVMAGSCVIGFGIEAVFDLLVWLGIGVYGFCLVEL